MALVSRQPIYGAAMTVIGYELLYDGGVGARELASGAAEATLRVVADAALEIGLDRLAGGLPVYIHYPRELLTAPEPLSLHPERVIIQVIEELPGDAQLIEALKRLRARGHRLALDQFAPQLNDTALLDLVDIVKIDVAHYPSEDLARWAPALVRHGLQLIAKEVESIEQFDQCLQ